MSTEVGYCSHCGIACEGALCGPCSGERLLDNMEREAVLIDVRYALGQLRRDAAEAVRRAVDSLQRAEGLLAACAAPA